MHRLRVLVVDDNPFFLSAARNLLSGLPEVGCADGLIPKCRFAEEISGLIAQLARADGIATLRKRCIRITTRQKEAVMQKMVVK